MPEDLSWWEWTEKEIAAAQKSDRRQQKGRKQGGTLLEGSRNWGIKKEECRKEKKGNKSREEVRKEKVKGWEMNKGREKAVAVATLNYKR